MLKVVKTETVLHDGSMQVRFCLENLDLITYDGNYYTSVYTRAIYDPLFNSDGVLIAFSDIAPLMNARLEEALYKHKKYVEQKFLEFEIKIQSGSEISTYIIFAGNAHEAAAAALKLSDAEYIISIKEVIYRAMEV